MTQNKKVQGTTREKTKLKAKKEKEEEEEDEEEQESRVKVRGVFPLLNRHGKAKPPSP